MTLFVCLLFVCLEEEEVSATLSSFFLSGFFYS